MNGISYISKISARYRGTSFLLLSTEILIQEDSKTEHLVNHGWFNFH